MNLLNDYKFLAYSQPVDMRKSFTGLYGVVRNILNEDPVSKTAFIFINRRRTHCKILFWDRTGFCLLCKKLERGRFLLRKSEEKQELSEKEVIFLLDGVL